MTSEWIVGQPEVMARIGLLGLLPACVIRPPSVGQLSASICENTLHKVFGVKVAKLEETLPTVTRNAALG
jgi:hypothetical protein